MKILVLGGSGMLGHQLVRSLGGWHDVRATLRLSRNAYGNLDRVIRSRSYFDVDVTDFTTVQNAIADFEPDAVINAIGVIKQRRHDEDTMHSINGEFPQRLAAFIQDIGSRLVQISTDCVFCGKKGMYTESDTPDAEDDYGRSKLAGEVTGDACITLRTSIIGLELNHKKSLIEWFLSQSGRIKGFRKAVFSGFTTQELANIIEMVLIRHADKQGLYHVSSSAIDKFTLLTMLRDRIGSDIEIQADDEFDCDRSLDSSRFRDEFDYEPPPWDRMLDDLGDQIMDRQT